MSHRWPLVLLAALGVVAAHGAAYGVAPGHGSVTAHGAADLHGYLPLVVPVVVVAAMVGLGWLIASRSGGSRHLPTTAALASTQAVVFLAQELIEHAVAGPGMHSALGSPAVWLGLVLQAVIACALLWVTRAGRRVVDRLRSHPGRVWENASGRSPSVPAGWPARWELAPRRPRGPPRVQVPNLT